MLKSVSHQLTRFKRTFKAIFVRCLQESSFRQVSDLLALVSSCFVLGIAYQSGQTQREA